MNTSFKCPECDQMTAANLAEMTYEVDGIQVTIKEVPAQVCPNGHSYVDGYTGESVNRLVNHIVEDVNAYARKLARPTLALRQVVIAA
jgi:YgiT-type zinc finger domain-containing protein